MRRSLFDRAAERLLEKLPNEDRQRAGRSLRAFKRRRLTTFAALRGAMPRLELDSLLTAVRLVPYLDNRRAPSLLMSTLKSDRRSVVRLEIAKALTAVTPRRATKSALALLRREREAELRYWLCYAISCLGDPIAGPALLEIVRDGREHVRVRSQAAEAMGYILQWLDKRTSLYRRSVDALIKMLVDARPENRFWAAFALGSAGARRALPELRRLAAGDTAVCPEWWGVGIEAGDAVRVIEGGDWPQRIPGGKLRP